MDLKKLGKVKQKEFQQENNKIKIEVIDDNLEKIQQLKKEYFKDTDLLELDKKRKKLIDENNLILHNLKNVKQTFKSKSKLKKTFNNNKKEIKRIEKYIKNFLIKKDKEIKLKNKKQNNIKKAFDIKDYIWKISSGMLGFMSLGLLFSMLIFKSDALVWIGATFTFLILFIILFIFLIFLGKKTHAILEFKALMSGKPLCLFFTDHKRVDWKVLEPEAGLVNDKQYGSFLINEKGSYIDVKTRNVLLPFNPSVATNAPVEAFNLSDGLAKVFKDEKTLSQIRFALAEGKVDENDCITLSNGEKLEPFTKLKESIDFSCLKSLMNTILPHNINSKIEMQVAQRLSGASRINPMQAVIIFVSILGAIVLAIMLLKIYGGNGTQTIVRETVKTVAQNATSVING